MHCGELYRVHAQLGGCECVLHGMACVPVGQYICSMPLVFTEIGCSLSNIYKNFFFLHWLIRFSLLVTCCQVCSQVIFLSFFPLLLLLPPSPSLSPPEAGAIASTDLECRSSINLACVCSSAPLTFSQTWCVKNHWEGLIELTLINPADRGVYQLIGPSRYCSLY